MFEDSDTTGINGPTNLRADDSGAAYVFERSAGVWAQTAYIKASNTAAFDFFGVNVAGSGDFLAVAASGEDSNAIGVNGDQLDNSLSGSGAVYVFEATVPPALVITRTGTTSARISWASPSTGWSLEENSDLTDGVWLAPPESITDDGTNKSIEIETTNASRFLRLAR